MRFGEISENEKIIEITVEIHCTNCGKQVPGGLKTGEKFHQSEDFQIQLEKFKKKYLCGNCRDKKRIEKS